MASEPAETLQLNYGAQPPSYRRWLRVFCVLAVIIALGIGAWLAKGLVDRWYAKRQYRRLVERWYPLACNRAENPPVLKYTEDPADAPGGFKSTVNGRGFLILHQDPLLDKLPMFHGNGDPVLAPYGCIVFSHDRAAKNVKWLLMVSMLQDTGSKIWLSSWMIGPTVGGQIAGMVGSVESRGVSVDMKNFAPPGSLRLFSGQPDSNDPARFWIPFQSLGNSGRICGTLIPGQTFSKDPQAAQREAEMNSYVQWTVVPNAPTTQTANRTGLASTSAPSTSIEPAPSR
jgi:hypothetical protein